MKKIKITTAKKNDPIYSEGWSLHSLSYKDLKTKTAIEKTKSSLDKETADVKKR